MKIFNPALTKQIIPIEKNDPKKRFVLKAKHNLTRSTVFDELNRLSGTNTKVCIYRGCGGIGDIVMCTPLLQAIKERFPLSHLIFAIDTKTAGDNYYNIVKNNPYIDEIISAHTVNRESYHIFKDISSVCIQYESSGLPWINRIDIFANACGFKLKSPKTYYAVEPEEREWTTNLISRVTKDKECKKIMLHTASFDYKRTWPIHKYTELISILRRSRSDLFFFINDFQKLNPYWNKMKDVYDVSQYRLRELGAITEQMDYFVGPDSGPMHIAGSLEIPGTILFGSIPPEARINYYPSFDSLITKLACSPCFYKPCPFNAKCMSSLMADKVASTLLGRLNE